VCPVHTLPILFHAHFHIPFFSCVQPNAIKEALVTFFRAVLGEVLVTFLFITCVVATSCNLSRANITDPAAQGLATALVSVGLIYSFSDVSGAHFNPAVRARHLYTHSLCRFFFSMH